MSKINQYFLAPMFLLVVGIFLVTFTLYLPSQAASEATFIVNSISDSDDGTCDFAHCSLREAIHAANNAAGADTITFSLMPSATITLSGSQLPLITDTLTIDGGTAVNLTISANYLSRVFEIGSGTAVNITTLTLSDGVSNDGGAIYNNGGILIISYSTISGNLAHIRGGGLNNAGGTMTIDKVTITDNMSSLDGGGIYNGDAMFISNSTINDNRVPQLVGGNFGGGIFNQGTLYLRNNTFSDNSGSFWHQVHWGAGIANDGSLDMANNIIANSIGSLDCVNFGVITVNFNNLIEDGSCSPAFTGDPLLGPLQDNGGLTWTQALSSISQAVDNGDDVTCAAVPVNNLDQRDVVRPFDGNGDGMARCDIGSYEYDGPPPSRSFLPILRHD